MKPILEQIHLGKQRSIYAFHYIKQDFEMPWHFHPQHELTYIEESTGTKFIGDYVGPYGPGEWVLVRSNLPHCWKNQTREDKQSQSQSRVVQWNKGIYTEVPELSSMFTMLRTASRGIIFDKVEAKACLPLIEGLHKLEGTELYVQLLQLLVKLAECKYETLSEGSFVDDLPMEYSSRMAKIHDFVEAHFRRKIYLVELADLVNMSEQSFSRFFNKMMGRPFFTFLNEYRINMASRMLIDTDWPITQIGFACGYESLPFFYKQFHKFKQETPSKFRKKFTSSAKS